MDYDPTAYDCLHRFALEWPCLRSGTLQHRTKQVALACLTGWKTRKAPCPHALHTALLP